MRHPPMPNGIDQRLRNVRLPHDFIEKLGTIFTGKYQISHE